MPASETTFFVCRYNFKSANGATGTTKLDSSIDPDSSVQFQTKFANYKEYNITGVKADFVPIGLSQFDSDKKIVDVCTYDTIEANINDLAGESMETKVQNATYRIFYNQQPVKTYTSNRPLAQ